jgi:G protein pathway suppressor 2
MVSANTMPAAITDNNKADRSEQMWKVLKAHILRERARKKQEREAEVEEERLRKEREAREQQDVMTLGETREQISQLETKLQKLKEEKHQLFLQLKKVLNEDDNRRRQKENKWVTSFFLAIIKLSWLQ